MRRGYISPEFEYKKVSGLLNMVEESTFFGSKMMDVPNTINITNGSILYYQNANSEQIDILVERNNEPVIFNIDVLKSSLHRIDLNTTQNDVEVDDQAKWVINVSIREILIEYIFASLKKNRTFEGVLDKSTIYNDVDLAIRDYITNNILSRYELKDLEFYVVYNDLSITNGLQLQNTFDVNALNGNLVKNIDYAMSFDKSTLTINFKQSKPSKDFSFNYYFNINFFKI